MKNQWVEEMLKEFVELGFLDSIEINIGSQKFTGYAKKQPTMLDHLPKILGSLKNFKDIEPNQSIIQGIKVPLPGAIYDPEPPTTPLEATTIQHHVDGSATITHETAPTQEQLDAQAALARMTGDAPPAERKKRGRPKKETFTLEPVPESGSVVPESGSDPKDAPVVPSTIVEKVQPESSAVSTVTTPSKTLEEWQAVPVAAPEPPAPKPVIPNLPNPDQEKEYKARLFKYTNHILPEVGKMMPTEGMGIAGKIMAFSQKMFPGVARLKDMNVDQWNQFLGFMDKTVENSGAEALVEHINSEIGAAD